MFFGGFGFDDDHLHRGDWSEKSGAASAREEAARVAFTALVKETSTPTTVELLKPSTHLTQPCWRDFKKFIGQHAGWSAKRRQATEAEKRQHGETRKAAVYFVDVTYKPPASKKTATNAGKKTVKKTPLDAGAEAAAKAQMASGMTAWIAGAKRPSEEEKEAALSAAPPAKKPCTEQEEANGFEVRFSRVSKVVEWDDDTFTDCRPSEARDSMEEHESAARKYDFSNVLSDEVDGGHTAMIQHLRAVEGVFESVGEANEAAKQCMAKMLALEAEGDRFTLTPVREGLTGEWSSGFKPPRTSEAPEETVDARGRGTYTGKITLFVDVHGCDVHNVVVSELKAVVVVAA